MAQSTAGARISGDRSHLNHRRPVVLRVSGRVASLAGRRMVVSCAMADEFFVTFFDCSGNLPSGSTVVRPANCGSCVPFILCFPFCTFHERGIHVSSGHSLFFCVVYRLPYAGWKKFEAIHRRLTRRLRIPGSSFHGNHFARSRFFLGCVQP